MRKKIIITVVIVFGLIGGAVAKLAVDRAGEKKADSVIEESKNPGVELQTQAPIANPNVTEEPTSTPDVTEEPEETPVAETTEPEVDYSGLTDDELIKKMIETITIRHESVKAMTDKERVVYSIYCYNNQMRNGLYTYLTGNENDTAAYVSNALVAIKAESIKELLSDFVDTFRIDLTNTKSLSRIKQDDYNFEMFDNEYKRIYVNENLSVYLANYIRENLEGLK